MDTNTQRLIHTFSTLADLGQEIADAGDFEDMLRNSFHLLLGSLAIRRGGVAEYAREAGQLRLVAARGLGNRRSILFRFRLNMLDTWLPWVRRSRWPLPPTKRHGSSKSTSSSLRQLKSICFYRSSSVNN
jgi:hypothetical protein